MSEEREYTEKFERSWQQAWDIWAGRGFRGRGDELLSAHPTQTDTFMELSVFDTVISSSTADEKIVMVMDDIRDFVSKI